MGYIAPLGEKSWITQDSIKTAPHRSNLNKNDSIEYKKIYKEIAEKYAEKYPEKLAELEKEIEAEKARLEKQLKTMQNKR